MMPRSASGHPVDAAHFACGHPGGRQGRNGRGDGAPNVPTCRHLPAVSATNRTLDPSGGTRRRICGLGFEGGLELFHLGSPGGRVGNTPPGGRVPRTPIASVGNRS
jgi:hypothetical protein